MGNQGQYDPDRQNMGCSMNDYPPSSSWLMTPSYLQPQPMQANVPNHPIPFPGISAPPIISFPSPVVIPPPQTSNEVVIDLANSVSDDDSSDESYSMDESETNSPYALHEGSALCSVLPRGYFACGVFAASLPWRCVCGSVSSVT